MDVWKMTQLVEEHLALVNRDWERWKSTVTPDVTYEEKATGQYARGADQVIEALKRWTAAFPDLVPTITKLAVCNGVAVAEVTWEGTQTRSLAGPLGLIPPSGNRAAVAAAIVYTFAGHRIKEIRPYFDLLTILRQVSPEPVPATLR